jgi:hypothetical protein
LPRDVRAGQALEAVSPKQKSILFMENVQFVELLSSAPNRSQLKNGPLERYKVLYDNKICTDEPVEE